VNIMSSDTQIAEIEAESVAAAPDTTNPALLGVPCAVIGVAALGLFLLGYAPSGSAGAVIPLFASLGIGLFVAARWAITLGNGPLASIFGLFGAFFFSFSLLYVGFVHNWYGTAPADASATAVATALTDTFSVFALCWAIGTTVLVLAVLRLPMSVFLVVLFSDLVFILVWLAFISRTFADIGVLRILAGICCLGAAIAGAYVFYASLSAALGATPLPLGRPVRS
jgi:succinate-acetate transporter protein